jgi:adenylate cyclase
VTVEFDHHDERYLGRAVPLTVGDLKWLVEVVVHRGVIDEFIGDAIFVLFGAPFSRPDDPERAVRCAWAMQEALAAFNLDSRSHGLPELSMGIGLHLGPVVAGNIGSPDRVKYGVVGPAVNLTTCIQALTSGGEVLLSDALLARA